MFKKSILTIKLIKDANSIFIRLKLGFFKTGTLDLFYLCHTKVPIIYHRYTSNMLLEKPNDYNINNKDFIIEKMFPADEYKKIVNMASYLSKDIKNGKKLYNSIMELHMEYAFL